jgi:hypothetical protein
MASSPERPIDHRYRDDHSIRTRGYLFRADRRHLIAAVGVFTVKHSRTAWTPWPASAGPGCPADNASASPSPAR